MIRINLLPQAKKPTRTAAAPGGGSGAVWAIVYLLAVVVTGVGCAVLYFVYDAELAEQQEQNRALEQRIQTIEKKSARLDEVKAKLARSKQLEKVVDDLNKARKGPTRVLHELSKVLSSDGGPTIDPEELEKLREDNPLAGYNRSWDVRRLWLSSFEEENRECRMTGQGKTNEDVAEFLRRLALSELFEQVTLTKTEMVEGDDTDLKLIGFELQCKVRY